jgi:hypothetical protein
MKRPSFMEGTAVALVASFSATVLYHALILILPNVWALHLLTAAISLGYIVYLLARSPSRLGRVSSLVMWALLTLVTLSSEPSLGMHLLAQLSIVWLIRSLYFYSSLLPALTDLGLSGFGLSAALWAAEQSGSIFLSVWCLFLVQALFAAIPPNFHRKATLIQPQAEADERFEHAHRCAENALRRLSILR